MPETRPPIDVNGVSLAELERLLDERKLPPVDSWHPEHCGDSGMRGSATGPRSVSMCRARASRIFSW